jgi:hypothetical protein
MSFDIPDPSSLFGGDDAPGRRARMKLQRSAGAAGGGFGGDLLSAAAGALGVAQADPLSDALVAVQVTLQAAPALASARLLFLPRADFPALALGDAISVELGTGDSTQPVFAGTVARQTWQKGGTLEVLLAGPAAKLARLRRNAGYEDQAAADLLQLWAAEAGLQAGQIDAGPNYAYFAIDDRRSLWDWVARIAAHADVPAWADAAGRLNAHKPQGQPLASFVWGETVLALDAQGRDPATTATRMVGEGSAGRQGSDAWAWLAKDPAGVSATGGAGLPGAVESDGALRDLASVAGAALGLAAGTARIANAVTLRVPGVPAIDVAGVFEINGAPGGQGDGTWRAVEVRHRCDGRNGFTTELLGVPL